MKRNILLILLLFVKAFYIFPNNDPQQEENLLGRVNGFLSKNVKLTGYGHFGYKYLDHKNEEAVKEESTFYGRLAMFILSGDITDELEWMVQYEAYSTTLLEIYALYKPFDFLQVKAGQMKTCFTLENQMSPSVFEPVNWSRAIGALAASTSEDLAGKQGGRDIGVQVGGKFIKMSFDDYLIDYRIGLFNGTGINRTDNNNNKDLSGFLLFQPLKGLYVGGSTYTGKLYYGKTIETEPGNTITEYSNITRNRYAASILYEKPGLTLRGEYLWGKDDHTKREGFYTLGQWFVMPSHLALMGRVEGYKADTKQSDYDWIYTIGTNYHITKKTRIMINYVHNREKKSSNEFYAQLQIGF